MVSIYVNKTQIAKYYSGFGLLLVLLFFTGCSQSNVCHELKNSLDDLELAELLIAKVDNMGLESLIQNGQVKLSGSMLPGRHRVLVETDWHRLGFPESSELRLLSSFQNGKYLIDNPDSLFFGRRNGQGYLVKFPNSSSWGDVDLSVVEELPENNRIAVMCAVRD